MVATSRAAAVVLALVPVASAWADPCPPSARVVGDRALVAPVASLLAARGVAVDGGGACAVHAELLADEAHQVHVRITDADGRTVERLASDPETAATTIESWARRDVGDPLLVGHAPAAAVVANTAAPMPRARRVELSAALDGGVSEDGGVWGGVRASGCFAVGDLCVGALVRYAADTKLAGDTAALDNGRRALDLAMLVALPLDRDRFTITPLAGLGQTSLTASRDDDDGEPEREQASSLFAHAGLAAAMHLRGAWSLRLDAGVAIAPFATPRLGDNDGVDRQLAALPYARGWLGLGVVHGGP